MLYKVFAKLAVLSSAFALAVAQGPFVFAVTDASNRIGLYSTNPSSLVVAGLAQVSGIPSDTSIISIAFRPKVQQLYAILNNNEIYNISTNGSSFATAQLAFTTNCSFSESVRYSVDFNPVADALRILGSDRSNYRIPFATATTTSPCFVDGEIAYIDGTAGTPRPSGVAYTNSIANPTSTAEYMIDANQRSFSRVSNPNAGSSNTTSTLPFAPEDITPLDFVLSNNENIGYLLNGLNLYRISLNGTTQFIGSGYPNATGLAIISDQSPTTSTTTTTTTTTSTTNAGNPTTTSGSNILQVTGLSVGLLSAFAIIFA